MRYLLVADIAKKWNMSERSVRNYCAHLCDFLAGLCDFLIDTVDFVVCHNITSPFFSGLLASS